MSAIFAKAGNARVLRQLQELAKHSFPLADSGPVHDASRNRSDGLSSVTIVFGATLFEIETPAPIRECLPITVSPPSTVAFA